MQKIISIGALTVGISAQQNFNFGQASPCAVAARAPNAAGPCQALPVVQDPIAQPVDAPCGCAKACPKPARANLPVQRNCCQVAMPCGGNRAPVCNTAPEKIEGAIAGNPVCSHVKFSWTEPKSCSKDGPS